jgi:molybdopterin-containing oxidoreductase family iron-sulfur binding subunit
MPNDPEGLKVNESATLSRRSFFKVMAWLGSILSTWKLIPGLGWANTVLKDTSSPLPKLPKARKSKLLRMQQEVQETMREPLESRDWVMVIDLKKCVGCHACTTACVAENHLPPGVVYRPVFEEEVGVYPQVTRHFLPRPCMQCNVPPCVPVCPVNATYKREDGIVPIDYDRCIGCRACIKACPYGSRTFDFGENHTDHTVNPPQPYESSPSPEYGSHWVRTKGQPPIGVVRKCHFCTHRLEEGMLPSCVTTCIGGATYFGPGPNSNPKSLVSQLIGSPRVMRLKKELGTEPRVYYLSEESRSHEEI